MSTTSKTILGVVVLVLIIIGVYILVEQKDSGMATVPAAATSTQGDSGTFSPTVSDSSSSASSTASGASIDSNVSAIDAQMNGLNADSANSAPGSDSQ